MKENKLDKEIHILIKGSSVDLYRIRRMIENLIFPCAIEIQVM